MNFIVAALVLFVACIGWVATVQVLHLSGPTAFLGGMVVGYLGFSVAFVVYEWLESRRAS